MRMRLTVPATAILLLTGCVSDQTTEEAASVPWSTKEAWAEQPNPELAHLAVPKSRASASRFEVREIATGLLVDASDSTNPLLRANALEAIEFADPGLAEPVLRVALGDENRGVRFGAAMMVGRLQLRHLCAFVEPLLLDPSESVQAAAIYALRRCDRKVDPSRLGAFVVSSDPEVRGNAVFILGELGDPAALPLLRDAIRVRPPRTPAAETRRVELQIAEAMVKLGQDTEIEVIRAALFVPHEQGELTALACQILGEVGDRAYVPALLDKATREGRLQEPAEIRLSAASSAARLDPGRGPLDVILGYVSSDSFVHRVQAAHGLGYFQDPRALATLETMLRDPNALVQVTAAGSLLRMTAVTGHEGRFAVGG